MNILNEVHIRPITHMQDLRRSEKKLLDTNQTKTERIVSLALVRYANASITLIMNTVKTIDLANRGLELDLDALGD